MIAFIPFIFLQVGTLIFWWLFWFFPYSLSGFARILVLLLFLCFFIGYGVRTYQLYRPRATIIAQQAFLYLGPDKTYPKRGTLTNAEDIAVEQMKDGWYYVSSSQGRGWVQATDIAVEGIT